MAHIHFNFFFYFLTPFCLSVDSTESSSIFFSCLDFSFFLSEGRRPIIAEDVASLSLSLSFSFCCWISLDYIIFFLSEKTLFPLSSLIYISSCRPLSTPPTPLLLHIKKSRAKWPDRQLLESAQMECRSATVIDVQSKSRPLRLRDMISMDIGDFKLQSKMFLMYIKTFPSSSLSVLFLYRI